MNYIKYLREVLLVSVYVLGFLGIVASGGGGGGGGGGSGGDDGVTPLAYVGNTDQATISPENAAKLVANTISLQGFLGSNSGSYSRPSNFNTHQFSGITHFNSRLSRRFRSVMLPAITQGARNLTISARTEVDEQNPCDSGHVSIKGAIENDGSGNLTLFYESCLVGSETLDGEVTAEVIAFDFAREIPTDAIYSFPNLSMTSPLLDFNLAGTFTSEILGNDEFIDLTRLVALNNATQEMVMITNQGSTYFFDNVLNPATYSLAIYGGLVYDSVHGYTSIKTVVPLFYSLSNQTYPDNGQLLLGGNANAGIQVRVISGNQTLLDLDLDGDALFETSSNLDWDQVVNATNISDSDSDGIYDVWEQANGLDLNDPSDAALDFDVDSFSNIMEHLGGSDPNSAISIPPSADVSVAKSVAGFISIGDSFNYQLSVNNSGPDGAYNVLVSDVLPVGVSFESAFGQGWDCIEDSGNVTCSRSGIDPGLAPTISITVRLNSSPIGISNTATVSSVTVDTSLVDNSDSTFLPENTWYKDSDADDFSNGDTLLAYDRPANYYRDDELIATLGDCDDNDPAINPDASDVDGDGIDQDCNGFEISGPAEVVFDWTTDRCEDADIPDLPARAFRDDNNQVQLIASHHIGRRSIGNDLNNVAHVCDVTMVSDRNPDPAMFNDSEWIASTYTEDGATIYAIIHNEYHGYDHPNQCNFMHPYWLTCWYNGLTLAVSTDGGANYNHPVAPPLHLIASYPETYAVDQGPYGIFHPSNIIKGTDGLYYAMVQLVNPAGIQWACLIRTHDLADPDSWRFWDGNQFDGTFVNPYTDQFNDPAEHVCQPVDQDNISDNTQSLSYNEYLDRYVLIGPAIKDGESGFFYSLSENLIDWTPMELMIEKTLPWSVPSQDESFGYPSLLDPNSLSRNFETSGKTAYLYYTRFNPGVVDLDRDLLRVPIEFFRN